ncbi:hypothetical protein NPN23_24480, partial [Vibrio parahaemolyticus]|nr:hypothetical protein [Vibrio parahaemolyticus]
IASFHTSRFDRLTSQALDGLVYDHHPPSGMASQASRQVLYGDAVFARPKDGTHAGVRALTLDDVREFYAKPYTPQSAPVG